MTLGGDPQQVRDLAWRLRRAAAQVDEVEREVRTARDVAWRGPAADRFLAEVQVKGARVRGAGDATLEAAAALEVLAAELEARQAAIRAAMVAVQERLEQAQRTLATFGAEALQTANAAERTLVDQARRALDHVGPLPPPGDPGWLRLRTQLAGL